ncbi:Type 1 glutamine amidotransferase-like domain-containing protein [Clostridium estertheticum]|uniref:Type 1 glutamine amidotransferase-like domain-containing protein n=1 Tax=Clostridium estertheticum TaxID=238834 RepID=UPI0013E987E8|nr:Type 1 glutamine amidotransferase-like domain-containing protein [Clostridium estertheticum]MBZ9687440.1 Type 1 glutamine amidotransferase-like domain-containing protein [Clostridium estertheticum]
MNLVLYSKLEPEINLNTQKKINNVLLEMVNNDAATVGLIEHTTDKENKYYKRNVDFYKKLGIYNILRFDLDERYNQLLEEKLFQCDIIHLPGGNTFYFLYMLKKRNMICRLQEYVKNGGIIVGVSAGALVVSPTIRSAQFGDENDVGLDNLYALGLVPFEIMPHWNRWSHYLTDLQKYSLKNNVIIYTVSDGEGIIVQEDYVKLYGDIGMIENGVYNKK